MQCKLSSLSFFLLAASSLLFGQTTLSTQTSNNTSACSDSSGHCRAAFTGMSDSASGVFNAAPGNVSHADMHDLEYPGATTAIFAHFMPWFCMQPGSTAIGPGTMCNGHLQVGYNSNDPATVKAQMDDMQERGIRGPVIDWYGPNATVEEGTTALIRSDLEGRCSGGSCDMQFALTEDQGSVTRVCPQDGGGKDQTSCILQVLQSDFDYMNSNYFPSPAYLRVDASSMAPSPQGRPVVFFFVCESCFTNPVPNWSTIFHSLRQHVLAYSSGDPLIWFLFRNAGAFTHAESDGGFAWENHSGSNDPYGLVYLDNFYDTSLKYPNMLTWGSAWKGFDNTLAAWNPAVHTTAEQCGNTWVQTMGEMTHNNDYSSARQLPFLQIVTWNDYEEGTEIETGIDNCLSIKATTDGTNLNWTPAFSATGTESTVDHYEVYQSTDRETLSLLATATPGTHALPIASMNAASQSPVTFYVEAIGRASILNQLSNAVTYDSAAQAISVTAIAPNSGTTAGGTLVTISGSNFQPGATVSFGGTPAVVSSATATSISASSPPHSAGVVNIVVTNPGGLSAVLSGAFAYIVPAAQITSISPTSGSTAGGTAVTITGTNFQPGATVAFGGSAATVKSLSATSISVATPPHAAGAVAVTVTNPGASPVSLASAFTYVAPAPYFSLSASPTSKTVSKGTTAAYSVTLAPHNGFSGTVVFSVSGLPSGATASFSPSSLTTSGTTKLSIGTRGSQRGTFTLTIKGTNTSKALSSTVKVSLTVR